MNEYDSEKLGDILKNNLNFIQSDNAENADVLLLNTCSIREKSQEKVFSELGRWKKIKEKKPSTLIAVGGCVASQEGEKIKTRSPQVDIVFGPQTIHRLPKMIKDIKNQKKTSIDISFPEIEKFDYIPNSKKKFPTAFVTIMEGCSKYCTFCVVPYTRGEEVSRRFDDIIYEVNNLAKLGTKEIILLGQNVNAYQSYMMDGKKADFATLVRHISYITGIKRIRHTTSHPIDCTDNFINEYTNPILADNLHLPVQSGSDIILTKMKRKHCILEYKNVIKKIRDLRPNISLTSDFIVGYPNETDYDFEQTMNLINELEFDDAYSFIYSKRPGTPASFEKDNISEKIKKKRLNVLQSRIKELSKNYLSNMINTNHKILVEGISVRNNKEFFGRTYNNKIVNFIGTSDLVGKMIDIKITDLRSNTLRGKL